MTQVCPSCSMDYDDFRTGFCYADIYSMFWSYDDDPKTWRNKRRGSVLGKWRELKLKMWAEHLETCRQTAPGCIRAEQKPIPITLNFYEYEGEGK